MIVQIRKEDDNMSIKADFHVHTSFSGDSEADMEEMIQKAIGMGLKDIAFTEHMDLNFPVTESTPEGFFECNVDFLTDGSGAAIPTSSKWTGRTWNV